MKKVIRIGTRDSELALWQANTVKRLLEKLGHEALLVPVKSTGDLVLDKPLYELGITGVFTRTLDIALLNEEIDIAVHSLKDVPTVLPKGIVQTAVLKRGNINDVLIYKKNEEFLAQKHAVIATGSLRRRAQWLNRYPSHTLVDLRGNVNSRLQKLKNNTHWNAAIFAAAGLKRIGLLPKEVIVLDWMIPAPAQGAIMITCLEAHTWIQEVCSELNHEETEICTSIERNFLNLLEGGCTAPIGALAYIKKEEVTFKGILLNYDGSRKIEVHQTKKLGEHHSMAKDCADFIIARGGKQLMNSLKRETRQANIFSTKSLTHDQKQLFHSGIKVVDSDFIKISLHRIKPVFLKSPLENVIITSKNAVEAIVKSIPGQELQFKNIFCVGRRTRKLIEKKIGPVKHTAKNAKELSNYLIEHISGSEVTYFCSNLRLNTLPEALENNNITLHEVEAYHTKYSGKSTGSTEGVMFYSPSTVKSYMQHNQADKIAFCIGDSTSIEAQKHFKDVRIAKIPTVESVIELVNEHYA